MTAESADGETGRGRIVCLLLLAQQRRLGDCVRRGWTSFAPGYRYYRRWGLPHGRINTCHVRPQLACQRTYDPHRLQAWGVALDNNVGDLMKTLRSGLICGTAHVSVLVFLTFIGSLSGAASAAILFESGTLGPTAVPQGSVAATNVNQFVFPGVRFQLTQPVITSQVGGHFVSSSTGTFFGAIVKLDDESDFPNSSDLSTSDVLGTVNLTFPVPSAEGFGNLALSLDPGWYALVFGSGLFGANGIGAAPRNNPNIATPTFIAFEPNLGWFNLDIFQAPFVDHRFVVTGIVIPEPSTLALGLLLLFSFQALRNSD